MHSATHQSVLLQEAVDALQVTAGSWYLDATFGMGGHTREILDRGGNVIALDFDEQAIQKGKLFFEQDIADGRLHLLRENFDQLTEAIQKVKEAGITAEISGVLFDFGTSTEQLMSQERGFSFQGDGPLDMRMDQRLNVQAKDLLAIIPAKQLAELFLTIGGEQEAHGIARAIKKSSSPITSIRQLSELVSRVKRTKSEHIHPATKVFQALRIAVNTELENIERALPQALAALAHAGRFVTIAFHEGEDRLVKRAFKEWEESGKITPITKKPLAPSDAEIHKNQRSRSAKMRIASKKGSIL